MNKTDSLRKISIGELPKKYLRNSSIRWKKVGFVMIPHELLFDEVLPRAALMVYWVLMVHQFESKNGCNPSLRLLEQETRYSRPTIISAINALQEQKWVEVERSHRKANRYFVKIRRQ